ncbi:MAG TPA: SDR family oxidoreductase [Vicinamibacteria bacterium]|nr:SDR family oxidoreductase [Vicinamibacteria bacterium]
MIASGSRATEAVLAAVTEVTGHPREILLLDADLEDDLGIRLGARPEILRRAAGTLGVPVPAAPEARTLRALAATLGEGAGARRAPLEGKVAFVTGSGHGIGKVLVRELAALGAAVVVNSFHSRDRGEATTAELVAEGRTAVHLWGSVAQPRHLDEMFDQIRERFGVLDIFVNNASNGLIAPLEHVTPEHWEKSYRTNVIALHQGAMRAAALMTRGGDIASLTSPAAQKCTQLFGCQGTIKAAVEGLLRYLAVELSPRGIRVNAIAPGPIYGELLDRYPESSRLIRLWESISPERRLRTEKEVAQFLVRYLTDKTLPLSGTVVLADSGVTIPMHAYR